MVERLKVVAVVPNYNMADNLANLLPQVLRQGYDRVFVLDDASTDHSVDVVGQFDEVTLVRNTRNQGAGTNRNQIMGYVADETILHFVDADMDVVTNDIAAVARELAVKYAGVGAGVIGGLVRRLDGFQEPFNYGPVFSLGTQLTTSFPLLVDRARRHPKAARSLARISRAAMRDWPDILGTPVPVQTYWVHEGNMLIQAGVFRAAGGYDPALREHETQDLAIKLEKLGVKRYFDPCIEVIHHHVDVRGPFRGMEQATAVRYIIRKHGLRRFLTD